MHRERLYRTEWRAIWKPDNVMGRLRIEVYYPHRVPIKVADWKDRFRDFGIFDVIVVGGAVVLVILSVATR